MYAELLKHTGFYRSFIIFTLHWWVGLFPVFVEISLLIEVKFLVFFKIRTTNRSKIFLKWSLHLRMSVRIILQNHHHHHQQFEFNPEPCVVIMDIACISVSVNHDILSKCSCESLVILIMYFSFYPKLVSYVSQIFPVFSFYYILLYEMKMIGSITDY